MYLFANVAEKDLIANKIGFFLSNIHRIITSNLKVITNILYVSDAWITRLPPVDHYEEKVGK
jgi:hypothetical protein